MIKMFHVTTRYYGDDIDWFVVGRAQRRLFGPDGALGIDYHEVIANHDDAPEQLRRYSEDAVEEMFTKQEADTLVAWLKANRPADDDNTTIRECALPVENNITGFGAIPVGGQQDFLMTGDAPDYNLPFKVWGYCDKRFSKQIGASK
jgi:hypothetical protein